MRCWSLALFLGVLFAVTACSPGVAQVHSPLVEAPPLAGHVSIVSQAPSPWTVAAWASDVHGQGGAEMLCWALYGGSGLDTPRGLHCGNGELGYARQNAIGEMALPELDTSVRIRGRGSIVAADGMVTPAACLVRIVFRGHAYAGKVVRIPIGQGRWIGGFNLWLPGRSWTSNQVTSETAYNCEGQVIARHGPW